mmetsp:Transcript_15438/g.19713  ORF Transcript_15438/g.19713 Transcript_15438/m.19713 type:complete len:89 (+) Transcript_15438:332-598(+)
MFLHLVVLDVALAILLEVALEEELLAMVLLELALEVVLEEELGSHRGTSRNKPSCMCSNFHQIKLKEDTTGFDSDHLQCSRKIRNNLE